MRPTEDDKETLINQSCKDTFLLWGAYLIYLIQFCVVMAHQDEWDWVTFGGEILLLASIIMAKFWKKKTKEDEEMIKRGSQASFNSARINSWENRIDTAAQTENSGSTPTDPPPAPRLTPLPGSFHSSGTEPIN